MGNITPELERLEQIIENIIAKRMALYGSDGVNLIRIKVDSTGRIITANTKANAALDNLVAVAINTSLISDADVTDDLGSAALRWLNGYIQKVFFNATASIDGATAGELALLGKLIARNNVAFMGDDNAGGTPQNLIKVNPSDQTEIGKNDLRATRFVAIDPPVEVVAGVDPAGTGFTTVDVTAETSARCYAIACNCIIRATTAGRVLFARINGSITTGTPIRVASNPVVSVFGDSSFVVGVDSGQIFEYAVDNADVDNVSIMLRGYWEFVD